MWCVFCERKPWSTLIARFMWPTWGPPGSWRPQVGPTLTPWTLLSGYVPLHTKECCIRCSVILMFTVTATDWCNYISPSQTHGSHLTFPFRLFPKFTELSACDAKCQAICSRQLNLFQYGSYDQSRQYDSNLICHHSSMKTVVILNASISALSNYKLLTRLPLDKMAAVSQRIFSDAFSSMKSFVSWLKFHWSLFLFSVSRNIWNKVCHAGR